MAADGSLRFDTKIDTSGFKDGISSIKRAANSCARSAEDVGRSINKAFNKSTQISSLENQIAQTEEKIRLLKAELDRIGESNTPTEEYKELSKLVEKTQLRLDGLLDRQEKLDSQGVKHNSSRWKSLQYDIDETSKRLEIYKAELQDTVNRDRAFISGQYSADYEKKINALDNLNNRLYVQKQRLMELIEKEGQAANEADKLRSIAENAKVGNSKIVGLNNRLEELKAQQKELSAAGVGLGHQEYDANTVEISKLTKEINRYKNELISAEKESRTFANIVKGAFSVASGAVGKFGKTLGNKLANRAKQAVGNLKNLINPTDKASKSILKLSNMFKLMLIRMAMRAVIDGVKEGMQNLVRYSNNANHAMSSLMNGMTYLKNSFAVAFAPILSFVAPALNTLIDILATAIGYINQFFSALGGSSTFIKAKKVNEDYAKSLKATGGAASKAGKDAKKALAPFDELTTLQDQASGSGSGGGSGSVDPSEMFETVAINDAVSSFADQIRKAFEASDWKELGTLIGNKFNETIDGIDWSGAGHKMGYAINGAVQTAYYALTEADFVNLGAHVAELLNSGLSEIDFTFIGRLLVRGFTVGIDFLIGLIGGLNWGLVGKSVGDLLRGSFDEYYDWITDIDWSKMAHDLYSSIKQFLLGVDFASLAESFFRAWGAALGAAVSFVASFLGDIWNDITGYFSNYITNDDGTRKCGMDWVAGVLQGILDAVVGVVVWIHDHVAMPIINGFKEAFGIHSPSTVMAELGGYLIEGLIDGIKNFLPNLLNTLTEMSGEMKQKLSEILTYISGAFKDGWKRAWDGVKDVFKGVFNGILSILESALNFIVNGINKLSFDIPDWIPEIGGAKFGFDIQPFHLPRLASGTVVPPRAGEFAAILGDNNREAEVVSPISAMKQAFKEAISEMGTGNGDIHLTVNLDGKVIFNDIIKRNQMAKRQTGKNPLLV